MSSKAQFNTLQYYFKKVSQYFYEQASHIRGPQTNYTVSLLSLNGLLAILKITLQS
jgi:hypothetical protein